MTSKNSSSFFLIALAFLFLGAACEPSPICEPLYVVTKTDDTNDGVCSTSDCSLREAVDNANDCAGAQSIELPAGNYPLTLFGSGEDLNETGDLDITDDLTIQGDGAPSISGEGQDRIFEIFSPATVELNLLIMINGNDQLGGAVHNHSTTTIINSSIHDNDAEVPLGGVGSSSGGGIFNGAGTLTVMDTQIFGNAADLGGGIHNFATATLVLENVLLQGNVARQTAGGLWNNFASDAALTNVEIRDNDSATHAGGVYNAGHLEGETVTFDENVAGLDGGGLYVTTDGETFLYDSWFTNNNASAGGGIYNQGLTHLYRSSVNNNTAFGGLGGGAYNNVAAALLMRNTTISANMIDAPPGLPGGSGIFNIGDLLLEFITAANNNRDGLRNDAGGMMNIRSSVVAYHALGNCTGSTPMSPSQGFNIEDQDTCDFIEPSDLVSTDPLLAALATNGGNGLSHLLNPGSPAIDSGDPDMCTAVDQRSVTRPQGSGCDRGSIEMEAATLGPAPTPVPTVTPPTLGTVIGAVCYPSEGIPPMDLYFLEVNNQLVSSFPHTDGSTSYSVELDPGTYVAYAYPQGYNIGGSYSQAVLCGLTVNCTDHSLVEFDVIAGQTTTNIDICDWYGDPQDVPLPSGEMPEPSGPPMIRFLQNAFCRKGPSTEYGTATAYELGQEVELIGRSAPGLPQWWVTDLRCWVSDSTGKTRGDVYSLSVWPAPPLLTIPEAPARLRLIDVVCDAKQYRVTVGWLDQANNEDGYRVYRDGAVIATLGANATSYADNPPRPGPHTYEVEAYNAAGASTRLSVQDNGCQVVN